MAPKTAHAVARAKAKKQRRILFVLVVPLAGALFYAYHTVSKLHQSPSATPPAATTTTASEPTAPAATTPSPAPTAPAVAPPATAVDSFTLLPSKDPFSGSGQSSTTSPAVSPAQPASPVVQKSQPTQPQPTQPQSKTTQPKQTQPKQTQPKKTQPKQTQPQPNKLQFQKSPPLPVAAVIAFDRTLFRVHLHKGFGYAPGNAGQPLFWLLSLTRKSAKILVAGKTNAYTLKVDTPKTLSDLFGNLHTLMLLPPGTPLPASVPQNDVTPTTTTGG